MTLAGANTWRETHHYVDAISMDNVGLGTNSIDITQFQTHSLIMFIRYLYAVHLHAPDWILRATVENVLSQIADELKTTELTTLIDEVSFQNRMTAIFLSEIKVSPHIFLRVWADIGSFVDKSVFWSILINIADTKYIDTIVSKDVLSDLQSFRIVR